MKIYGKQNIRLQLAVKFKNNFHWKQENPSRKKFSLPPNNRRFQISAQYVSQIARTHHNKFHNMPTLQLSSKDFDERICSVKRLEKKQKQPEVEITFTF